MTIREQNLGPLPSITTADREALRQGSVEQLKRLLRLRRDHADELNDAGLKLLDTSITSSVQECKDHGCTREAHDLLRKSFPELFKETELEIVKKAPIGTDY